MTVVLTHGDGEAAGGSIRIGLVNNMPDRALAGTERQFLNLLRAAMPEFRVELHLFSLSGVPRAEAGEARLKRQGYHNEHVLPHAPLDALIVTGTEPRCADLKDEPYWPALTELFGWLERDGPPVMFSCLAAHAALLHFDGIERQRLPEKRFGVFPHARTGHNRLTECLPATVAVAHSRYNEVADTALVRCGYQILTHSPEAGVDLFAASRRGTWLFAQGHPEYDPGALGREYQRDVGRFLRGERPTYPELPKNYYQPAEAQLLMAFRKRAESCRSESILDEYPLAPNAGGLSGGWPAPTAGVIGAWLQTHVRTGRQTGASTHGRRKSRSAPIPALADS